MSAPRRRCLRGRLLADYLSGALRPSRKAVAENHLALCADCRNLVQAAAATLSIGVTAEELQLRLAVAASIVSDVLEKEPPHRWRSLIETAEWGTDRFVAGRLLERSREEFGRAPRLSMHLARAAVYVAERAESLELQFEGWRDCVSIAVFLGAFTDAWEAVERAAAIAPRTHDPEHAKGLVLYARAYVASQPDVWELDQALRWAEEAARIFGRTDAGRLRTSDEMRAYLHYCRGEHAAAVEICRKLWDDQPEVGLALNFATYLVALGRADDADDTLVWARLEIKPANTVSLARHALIEGRARAVQQRWDEALEAFNVAAAMFRRVEMEDTAIRVDLGRIRTEMSAAPDSLTAIQKAVTDLRRVVAISVDLDRREPTRRRRFTVEAIDYLRELAEANALTTDLVLHVEDYIDAITRGPARPFVRPLPTRVM